ncbi:energy-coupling factor transporter ATPase [Oenococcus kitaharae]|uniref:ABC-type cobalt transport system ATPase component n=1 Tax=Oenococcus kitaharae DSM 17330 TaxID=1045004 RepID=G9WG70_9LACO|nr:energy-coupling factor transporter ATPase [Oenococcus kitaharae]EHN59678.1 ABC-type cobalt transport system ATPase component [Oenococcus kitaharae DSM 17330]OEY83514.1 cobalt transporter ATP-binding subunit [Oenococcus kitaharae]OEY85313.1 cobalt transporter ATP-binding subunit [Oenococcus kitaharae]OEY86167.1 cobalt transporter ATP-binding subunit [Oenococcus kitaharae]
MADALIKIKDLSFHYAQQQDNTTLDHLSLSIQKGSWTTIIGRNGSGKSTLIKLLTGLLENQSQDAIRLFGRVLSEDTVDEIRSHIGLVFQNPDNQFVGPTVADDVAFGLENLGLSRDHMEQRVKEALENVGMQDFYDWEPARLSGGQKQRVALAGVLALQSDLIILDEATSMIDPIGRQSLLALVKQLQNHFGMTILSVTHDIEETFLADQILVMDHGSIALQGRPSQILVQDQALAGFGIELPLSRIVQRDLLTLSIALPSGYLSEEELIDQLWQLYSKK